MDFRYPTRPLSDFATLLSGGTPSKVNPNFWNGDIPWITPKDMANWSGTTASNVTIEAIGNGTRLAPAFVSYVAVRGMSLHNEIRVVRPTFPASFNQDIKAIVAGDGIDSRFLYYCLVAHKSTLLEKVESAGHGTGRLPTDQLECLPIPNVENDVAVAVAKVLGDLDDKIELLRDMNQTLEEIGRTVFRTWFVDFEPIRAKAEGAKSFRGMPQGLFDALPATLELSGAIELPTGWAVDHLDHLVSVPITRGLAPKYCDGGGMAVLNQKCIRDWQVTLDHARRHDITARSPNNKILKPYDILVNSTGVGTLGRVAQLNTVRELTTFDTHITLVRPDTTKIAPLYLGHVLTEREDEIERLGHGSTGQTELGRQKLGGLRIVVPQFAVQSAFDSLLAPIIERREANRTAIETLIGLRDVLLPKLISGELEAPSLEALGLEVVGDGG